MAALRLDGMNYGLEDRAVVQMQERLLALRPGEHISVTLFDRGGHQHWIRIPFEAAVVITTGPGL